MLLSVLLALAFGCASDPEPMRTGITSNPRYHPPSPASPAFDSNNPVIVGDSAWQSEAAKWIGSSYRPGGDTREGMDALGLVRRMYQNVARIRLTAGLNELSRTGVAIPREQLLPGDIIFFGSSTIDGAGIFIGDNRFVTTDPVFGVACARLTDPRFSESYRIARRILR